MTASPRVEDVSSGNAAARLSRRPAQTMMSIFGVGTSLPVIYLIYLAFAVDDSVDLDGTGIY